MKKIYYFFVNIGKATFISFLLLVLAISLHSFTIKGKVNYGDRCNLKINNELIDNIEYEGIALSSNYSECNTCYLEYVSSLNEKENLNFLAYLSANLREWNLDGDYHIIIKSDTYQLISTIVDYKISYIKTYI